MPEIVDLNEETLAQPVLARWTGEEPVTMTGEFHQGVVSLGDIITVPRRELLGGAFLVPATEAERDAQIAEREASAEAEATVVATPPVTETAQKENGSSPSVQSATTESTATEPKTE